LASVEQRLTRVDPLHIETSLEIRNQVLARPAGQVEHPAAAGPDGSLKKRQVRFWRVAAH